MRTVLPRSSGGYYTAHVGPNVNTEMCDVLNSCRVRYIAGAFDVETVKSAGLRIIPEMYVRCMLEVYTTGFWYKKNEKRFLFFIILFESSAAG